MNITKKMGRKGKKTYGRKLTGRLANIRKTTKEEMKGQEEEAHRKPH